MSVRTKVTLYIAVGLVAIGSVVFILGPVLFASIAYPLPKQFQGSMAKWTNEYCKGVATPNFLAALIYTESTWNVTAHSYAGAVGLTQFIPSTAVAVAQRLGVSPFTPSDLTSNPDLAIRFGAHYICGRIRDYGGNVRKGLIAYNGGGGAVLAYEAGSPIGGTVAYADKILTIEKAYDKIYGQWWKNYIDGANNNDFELKPKTDLSLVITVPILDFWRGLLSPSTINTDLEQDNSSSGVGSIWQFFLPGN
ncbi:MAG: transglycosylase SLT domain-containing protein [Patescibacteria group bacterium]